MLKSILKYLRSKLHKWGTRVAKVVSIALILSLCGNLLQFLSYQNSKSQLDIERKKLDIEIEKLDIEREKYEKAKRADLVLDYFVNDPAPIGEPPTVSITNAGDREAESVWLSEKIYLVTDSMDVFECELPEFSYYLFNGSNKHMFNLAPNDDTSFHFIPANFDYFAGALLKDFRGKFVSKFTLEYYNKNIKKREISFFYFLISASHTPLNQKLIPGVQALTESIDMYERYGPGRYLKYDNVWNRYSENPPQQFYFDENGNLKIKYPNDNVMSGYVKMRHMFDIDFFGESPTIVTEWKILDDSSGDWFPPRGPWYIGYVNGKRTGEMFYYSLTHITSGSSN